MEEQATATARTFWVAGKIKGKGRPRFTSAGKFGRAYTPKDTVHYEALIRIAYQEAHGTEPMTESGVPLTLIIMCYFPIPKSWSKKKRAEAGQYVGKPDADNIIKAVGDSLNGVAYYDDAQIADVICLRRYSDTQYGMSVRIQPPDSVDPMVYATEARP